MHVRNALSLLAVVCVSVALVSAQGLNTTATKDDWEEINFEFNSATLSDGYPSLLRLAELLHVHPDYKATLEGNTDSAGSDRYNEKLSSQRAETVKSFLVKYGAGAAQIATVAQGKRQPKVTNQTKEGRLMNRRVTMTLVDGQGRTVAAGGVSEAIKAMQAAEQKQQMCCQEVLKRLDKLDEILAAIRDLKAENDKLKQDVAALQQAQTGVQRQVAELPKPPERAELQQMMTTTANDAINQAKPSRFALLGLNVGPTLGDTFRPGFDRDIKMSSKGNLTFSGKGRYFAPFGKTETSALQAEAEYLFFPGRQEGQFDIGLVNRWKDMQLGLFSSIKHVNIGDLNAGGTLGQGVLTADYLFKQGRIGFFGTKGYLNDRVLARTPVQTQPGLTTFNIFDVTSLRVVDQIGGSTSLGLWKTAYMDANFGALFSKGGENRPGGTVRLVQPLNSLWAFTVEASLNPTFVGPTNDGRIVFGLQLGNWLNPKQYTAVKHPVPVDIPRVRYELITRRVRTGNTAPVADAGPDQIGIAAGIVTLDGSASSDPDGDQLTYLWTQFAGPSVNLSSPAAAKTTFTAAEGQTYSFRLTVKDGQGAQGTAKVTVTTKAAPPVRVVRFTAGPASINPGQSSTLAWQVEDADSVEITGLGSVNPQGTSSVSPTQTTTYKLTARNAKGEVNESVTVTVGAPQVTILSFQASPRAVPAGQLATLTWQVLNATDVTISGVGKVNPTGSLDVYPTTTTTYTLTASNAGGQVTATATVRALLPAKVTSFTASPATINAGEPVLLSWTTENAASTNITPTIGSVPLNGSVEARPMVDTTYVLAVRGETGLPVHVTVTVKVNPAPPR